MRIPPDLEAQLREHAVTLQKMFYGVTGVDMRKFAFDFGQANHLRHPFNQQKKMVGSDLLISFVKSNNVSLRTRVLLNNLGPQMVKLRLLLFRLLL
jgi:hypothetical protein